MNCDRYSSASTYYNLGIVAQTLREYEQAWQYTLSMAIAIPKQVHITVWEHLQEYRKTMQKQELIYKKR
jgi:hypothetical protein